MAWQGFFVRKTMNVILIPRVTIRRTWHQMKRRASEGVKAALQCFKDDLVKILLWMRMDASFAPNTLISIIIIMTLFSVLQNTKRKKEKKPMLEHPA